MQTRFIHERRPSDITSRAPRSRPSRPAASRSRLVHQPARGKKRVPNPDADMAEAADEDAPLPASKRRKIINALEEEPTAAEAAPSTSALRRSVRRSDAQAATTTLTAAADNVISPAPVPTPKPRAGTARLPSTAAHNPDISRDKDLQKALQEKQRTLKRDRQTFEQKTKRALSQLGKRESAADKMEDALQRLHTQLNEKITAAKEREQAAKKLEAGYKTKEQALQKRAAGYKTKEQVLQKREAGYKTQQQALKKREADCKILEARLEERESELQKREQEVRDKALVVRISRSDEAIDELESRWQCALCFDVMACPYSLSPAGCGHTYCAICILKWYFTNLCNACGDWCNYLDCPLCRAVLPRTVEQRPRPMYTLPFTPARAADERITYLLDSLRGPVPESRSKTSSPKRAKGKAKKKKASSDAGTSTGWEHGGVLRAEWQDRDSRGRTEMRNIVDQWPRLTANELREIKIRVCAST